MKPLPDYGELMTRAEFEQALKGGMFIDYDGSGCYATDKEASEIDFVPSTYQRDAHPEFTHIIWFNK